MKVLTPAALIPFLICLTVAQEKLTPRVTNYNKIARTWNSIQPATEEWNRQIGQVDKLLHERFNPKIVVVDPDQKRRETVAAYKAAREALIKELEALNTLIEEEDY